VVPGIVYSLLIERVKVVASDRSVFPGPPTSEGIPEDGKLKSEVMVKDNRRYYLDLKENQRGRFLRVSL